MITRPGLEDLKLFNQEPTQENASRLVSIPAIFNVLNEEGRGSQPYPELLLDMCQWVYNRGKVVLDALLKHGNSLDSATASVEQDKWEIVSVSVELNPTFCLTWKMETGCCYSMPKIRSRPIYPSLRYDQQKEQERQRGGKCSKYYSKYGQQRLTGGIMCAWCTHSVCYGFHCIPRSEGRDDVFSAMVTHWPKALKRVIYDFACALGPYCLTREPEFFADTLFVIDTFHSGGHTKCTPAAFLSTYSSLDPRLSHINSSAAECGNGGISRICKSVSYMGQRRAILYTKTFVSVWNRRITRKMMGLDKKI
jgi:hypothetical protein